MPKTLIAAITIFLLLILQMSTDIYLPSFPYIAQDLIATQTSVQLTLSLFLGGFAVSQLFYSPLSDYFGRKPILLFGILFFLLMNILSIFVVNIDQLLWLRFLAGVGGGSCSVVSRAITRDIFTGKSLEKIASYQLITWSIIPIIAPLIGSYIQHYSGWRYNFIFLSIIGILAVNIIYFLLPETRPIQHKPNSLQIKFTFKNYLRIPRHS
jgi:Bcr/CflA subfamily drug resistance transporter